LARIAFDIGMDKSMLVNHQLDSAAAQSQLPAPGSQVQLTVDPASVTLFEEVESYEAEERL
jgi:hypothetical protein